MTRELKLALIVGFSLVLVVTVLISDHLSKARNVALAEVSQSQPALTALMPVEPGPLVVAPPAPVNSGAETKSDLRIAAANAAAMKPLLHPEPVNVRQGTQTVAMTGEAAPGAGASEGVVRSPGVAPAPEKPESTVAQSPEKTHTVADGDSLYKIAKQYYGNGNLWKKIADANPDKIKGESLKLGSKLRIPVDATTAAKQTINDPLNDGTEAKRSAKGKPSSDAKQTGKKGEFGTYTVKKGDTLNDISRRVLGSAQRSNELIKLNENILDNEDSVQIGMVLKIPLY